MADHRMKRSERVGHVLNRTGEFRQRDRVGYADMNSFRRLFREHTGMTPHDYREKFRVRARQTRTAAA